jgi:hypothetical protein
VADGAISKDWMTTKNTCPAEGSLANVKVTLTGGGGDAAGGARKRVIVTDDGQSKFVSIHDSDNALIDSGKLKELKVSRTRISQLAMPVRVASRPIHVIV